MHFSKVALAKPQRGSLSRIKQSYANKTWIGKLDFINDLQDLIWFSEFYLSIWACTASARIPDWLHACQIHAFSQFCCSRKQPLAFPIFTLLSADLEVGMDFRTTIKIQNPRGISLKIFSFIWRLIESPKVRWALEEDWMSFLIWVMAVAVAKEVLCVQRPLTFHEAVSFGKRPTMHYTRFYCISVCGGVIKL